jgi:hypothetical protein
MTMWLDQIRLVKGRLVYGSGPKRKNLPGFNERLKNLMRARDHCAGKIRIVIVIAKAGKPNGKRSIGDCVPYDKLIMRITRLNDKNGAFRAESLRKQPAEPKDWRYALLRRAFRTRP